MDTEGITTKNKPEIDREKFLSDNKLSDVIDLFVKRDITIEELIEFDLSDIATFAVDIGLDSLQKNRFLKAIKKLKSSRQSNNNTKLPKKHIIISQEENDAIAKLYDKYSQVSEIIDTFNESFTLLNTSEMDCINSVNDFFNELISNVENHRQQLIKACDIKSKHKQNILNTQLELLNKYIILVSNGNDKCKEYMSNTTIDSRTRKKELLSLVDNLLNHKHSSLILLTAPKTQFNVTSEILHQFLDTLSINDCDIPLIPNIKVLSIQNDAMSIKLIKNKAENKKITLYKFEWCKLPKSYIVVEKKKDKKRKKIKRKKYDSDSSDYSDDSNSDSDEKNKDTSDSSNSNDDKIKKKRKKKESRTQIKYEQLTDLKDIDEMGWLNKELKTREYMITKLKANTAYAIRVQCKNDSGWGSKSIPIKIQTLNLTDEWDPTCIGTNCRLVKKSITQTSTSYSCSFGRKVAKYSKRDKYYWKFKIKNAGQTPSTFWGIVIGIWKMKSKYDKPTNFNTYFTNQHMGYAINVNKGTKINLAGSSANGGSYGVPCGAGDIVDMCLNYHKMTLSYSINGKNKGIAFSGIEMVRYRAALTMNSMNAEVELL